MSVRELVGDEDREDVRLAVVMNGGVSLAIWIGGIALELNRLALTSMDGPAGNSTPWYADLLEITKSTARIDVIAGTSAGGINGGLLALGLAYGRDLATVADLWADRGAF